MESCRRETAGAARLACNALDDFAAAAAAAVGRPTQRQAVGGRKAARLAATIPLDCGQTAAAVVQSGIGHAWTAVCP